MDAIYKLQPHRTVHLQGFDGYGATAALWGASDSGFTLSGIWGEQDDFVVLVLWDADNQFEHPRARYLPDFAFDGITLGFDLAVTNCVAIDCDLFPWIDWAFLNVTFADGTAQQVRLSDYATGSAYVAAACGFTLGGTVTVGDYVELGWLDQHFNHPMVGGDTLVSAITALAAAINGATATTGVSAVVAGAAITLTFAGVAGSLLGKGANGNRIGVYGTVHGVTENWSPASTLFTGGGSPATWAISLALSTVLTQTTVQRMWLTFAPPIAAGAAFTGGDFSVSVTGWTVTDGHGNRQLKVAGPGSVRIEEDDSWVARSGYWEAAPADGFAFWSQGQAIRSAYNSGEARKLTVETHCGATHDIYVGTRLDGNCGQVQASLDGGAPVTLDGYGSGVQVRRKLFGGVAAGAHSVTITLLATKNALSSGWYFYFDFLECAVLSDVPDAPAAVTTVAVATDFDTDITYKLSPTRLIWGIQKTGLVGMIDHYLGVFWWPARKMLTASTWAQQSVVTFSGAPSFGATTSLILGGSTINHGNLIGDTGATVALALALLVNQGSTVFWAEAVGAVLTLHGLAGSANYHIAVSVDTHDVPVFTAAVVTTNAGAAAVVWGVDDAAAAPVNTAVAAWHADYFAGLAAAGMACVVSLSQELVNPPAAWAQRFYDGTAVATATGFGTLFSSQCCFSAAVGAYMGLAYAAMAALMEAAGLVAWLQCGEVGWWFAAGGSPVGMAYYDADTTAAFLAAQGRALAHFVSVGDDPAVNGGVDAGWLAARLAGYVAAVRAYVVGLHAAAKFELLWPLDVNLPETRRLNWAVNLPAAWKTRAGSGFDSFLCEGFQFGGTDRDLNLVGRTAGYPFTELSWDRGSCGYLMGLFNGGWPWVRDYLMGARSWVPVVKIWAYDHVCLYGRMVPVPVEEGASVVTAGS